MPITGKYFPSQKSEEKVFLLLRRHWISYGIFLFLFVLMLIPLFLLVNFTATTPDLSPVVLNIIYLVLPAYLLIMLGLMLYGFVDYYLDVYIVTNERIVNISQNGFFKRDISELHLHQVQDVSAKEVGMFPTIFHYGDVMIQTAGERENFVFKAVPHPYIISKKIVDLHEAQLEESQREELELGEGDFSGTFNPEVLSVARKRTKDFFAGDETLDTGISLEDLNLRSEDAKNKRIISGIDESSQPQKKHTSAEDNVSVSPPIQPAGAKGQTNIPGSSREGGRELHEKTKTGDENTVNKKEENDKKELHENEEIDL